MASSLSASSSVSSSDVSSRRRALHFDADSTSTRDSPQRPIVTRPGRNRGHLHRVDPYSRVPTNRLPPDSSSSIRNSLDDVISIASSVSSSSETSGSVLSSLSSSSSLPLFTRQGVPPTKKPARARSQDVTKSRSRSVTWSKAINAGIGSGSVGVGIGSINHHHPLKEDALPNNAIKSSTLTMPNLNAIARQRGLSAAVQYTIKLQGRKISSAISTQQKLKFSPIQRLLVFIVPCLLLFFGSSSSPPGAKYIVKKLDAMTKQPDFSWRPNRRLQNRGCVLNMFIEKQAPDEFNPDYEEIKPGEKNKDGTPKLPGPPKMEKGTYRTKGQVEVVLRFISSVADSFRPNIDMQQHLVFTGSRDGGHLAEEALKFWPPRGKYLTKLYVVSDHENAPTVKPRDHSNRALQYGPLDVIEERFQNHVKSQHIHIFDFNGQKAGLVNSRYDDDDVAQLVEEEMFHMEDDTFGSDVASVDDDIAMDTMDLDVLEESDAGYFSLKKLLHPYLERNEESNLLGFTSQLSKENRTKHVIPYFHVDGTHASQQFQILQSARPLITDGTISIIGVENSKDLDVNDLIDFFHGVGFKTFLLGKRQVMRIDHLCPEILEDLMTHSYIKPPKVGLYRRTLERLKLVKPDLHAHMKHPHEESHLLFPAFFVGFPRGRVSKEEMTIQHMYDLFGGGGGGGQIATANDRKVPQKKKK